MNASTTASRLDTIKQAINLMDTATPGDLARHLAQTDIHDHLKADPATLRQHFAATTADSSTGQRFSAWKAAQQILQAAGLPY